MGMDVSGINPTTTKGSYFRANVWSWRPIHELVCEVCSEAEEKILTDKQLQMMSFNDGAPGKVPRKTLNRLIKGLKQKVSVIKQLGGDEATMTCKVPERSAEKILMEALGAAGVSTAGLQENPYRASVGHIENFVTFLEGCGDGFEVW